MKYVLIGLMCGLMLAAQGCATLVTGGSTRPVRVVTDPPGASVYVADAFKGKTPLTLNLSRRDRHRVRIEREQYATYARDIKPGFNPWFLGNLLFGGIIGVVVDLASGAVVTPTPGGLKVILLPEGGDYNDKAQVEQARDAAEARQTQARADRRAEAKAAKAAK